MLKQKPLNMNAKRSISLVVNALLDLMNEKPFKNITISELTKRAGVVRNTFYAHFETKEDVLSYYIFNLFTNKFNALQEEESAQQIDLISVYYDIWAEQVEFLDLLNENGLLSFLNRFETHLELFCNESYIYRDCGSLTKKAIDYATTVYANAMASILIQWIETGKKETPEELTSIFHELVDKP